MQTYLTREKLFVNKASNYMACGRRAQNEIDRIEKVATVVEF